jgi:hypothetical protein
MPTVDSRGRYFAIGADAATLVHLLGPDGRLAESIGKTGTGPGEWRPRSLRDIETGPGDTLFVFSSQRAYVFSPTLEFVREFPFTGYGSSPPNGIRTLADGRFILASSHNRFSLMTSAGELDPVTVRDAALRDSARAEWQRLGKMGEPLPVGTSLEGSDTTRCMECGIRTFAEGSTPGTIWSASPHQYVVEQHDFQGKLLRRVVRDVAWYPKWPEETLPAGMEDGFAMAIESNDEILKMLMKSRVFAMSQDAAGILWVFSVTPDPTNPIPRDADIMKMLGEDSNFLEQHFATVIEAIDAERGVLLSNMRLRGQVYPLGRGLVAHVVPDEVTGRSHRILRLSLRGYTPAGR